jgi:hypothetical protein
MAKLTARGHREVARWISDDREAVLVLRSDGAVLRGFRRREGGYDYSVWGHGKPGAPIEAVERGAARLAERLGMTRA